MNIKLFFDLYLAKKYKKYSNICIDFECNKYATYNYENETTVFGIELSPLFFCIEPSPFTFLTNHISFGIIFISLLIFHHWLFYSQLFTVSKPVIYTDG